MAVPYTFATATAAIPLSQLDSNFSYFANAITVNTASTALTIDASGNVGIGTTSPSVKFHVNGTGSIASQIQGTTYGFLNFNTTNNSSVVGLADSSSMYLTTYQALPILFSTNGTERMRIDSSGNVGIGTSSPLSRLSLSGSGVSVIQDGDYFSGGAYYGGSPANWRNSVSSQGGWAIRNTGGVYTVYTGSNPGTAGSVISDMQERMRIDSSGNVGIGTASPTQTLTVNGAVGYNAPISVTGATYSVAATDNWIIANRAGTVTLTLPTASSYTGRILTVKNVQAQTVVSASSNVVPIGSTTAGTAILAATAGKFAKLVSDGTNWIIMQAN